MANGDSQHNNGLSMDISDNEEIITRKRKCSEENVLKIKKSNVEKVI